MNLTDYHEQTLKDVITQLEPGATAFHKAFGYGSVVDLGDGYIEVAFDNDGRKKKPSRKFMLPGSFSRVFCRLGRWL